jgi:hypothetical protein
VGRRLLQYFPAAAWCLGRSLAPPIAFPGRSHCRRRARPPSVFKLLSKFELAFSGAIARPGSKLSDSSYYQRNSPQPVTRILWRLIRIGFRDDSLRTLHVGFRVTTAQGFTCEPDLSYLTETAIPDGLLERESADTPGKLCSSMTVAYRS